MASTIPDLWPSDLETSDVVPPVAILRQQAGLLGEKTQNLVEGQISMMPSRQDQFHYAFFLVAPALENYRFLILRIEHGIAFYPLLVKGFFQKEPLTVASEDEFIRSLRMIFSHEETRKVITALLAQSKS